LKEKRESLIIGSRESLLAVRQARIVLDYLRESCPDLGCDLHTMKTTGDRILDKRLDQIGGKGLFVRELDQALRAGRTDLSVHSLKDVPAEVPEDLPLIGFSEREDPRDVLVLPAGAAEIDFTKPIGTSSRRRILQARDLFPQARFESVRGNVQTRLRKLDEGQYGAIILAAAGLRRLGLEEHIIDGARKRLRQDEVRLEDVISSAQSSYQLAEEERAMAVEARRELDKLRAEAEAERRKLSEDKARLQARAREDARRLVEDTRKELEGLVAELRAARGAEQSAADRAIQKARDGLRRRENDLAEPLILKKEEGKPPKTVKPGDTVRIVSLDKKATVLAPRMQRGRCWCRPG